MNSSAWSPLRQPLFRALWIASVASNLGTAMHDIAAGWLMTSLSTSTIMVSLMQTASSLPIFLVALPAGALADLVDRRRLLLITQGWMLITATLLGILTVAYQTHLLALSQPVMAWLLLGLTFLLGLGGAINAPAWQATTSDLVPRADVPAAVAMGGIGFNLARTFGPALGGLIVAAAGSGAVFLVNAASFVGVMFVLFRWRGSATENSGPEEHLREAMRSGRRYVRHSPALHAVLVRTAVFVLGGSAMWALLPIVGRRELHLSALGYGGLMGCFGLGAVLSATLLPIARKSLSLDSLLVAATVVFAFFVLVLALSSRGFLVYPAMAVGGASWMSLMSSFNVAAQTAVPAWVRARALSIYLLVFQGGLAIGSVVWGTIASHIGVHEALVCAAGALLLGLIAVPRFGLGEVEDFDFTPSQHWAEPDVESEPHPDDGPVLISVEYEIEPQDLARFALTMREVETIRRRDGAYRWNLYRDAALPRRCVEVFLVESWAEHLRQHQRVTVGDRAIEERATTFHRGEEPPQVRHFIAAYAASLSIDGEVELPDKAGFGYNHEP